MVKSSEVHHVGICVKDLDKSLAFYRDLLGLEVWAEFELSGKQFKTFYGLDEEPHFKAVVLKRTDVETGLLELYQWLKPSGKPTGKALEFGDRGLFWLAFTATDIDRMYEKLVENGVEFVSKLMPLDCGDLGTVRAFVCRDPDGVLVEFAEYQQEESFQRSKL
jgi:lactoylglutathione lyase